MKLNELRSNPGARQRRMTVGRGIGSGKGKTCGRGVKGQKARTGVSLNGFEGGQMPLYRRLPKMGFNQPNQCDYVELTIEKLAEAIESKKIDIKNPVDAAALVKGGVIRRERDGVRLIGKGTIKGKVTLVVAGASKGAIASVEAAGGKVEMTCKAEDDSKPKGKLQPKAKPAKKDA